MVDLIISDRDFSDAFTRHDRYVAYLASLDHDTIKAGIAAIDTACKCKGAIAFIEGGYYSIDRFKLTDAQLDCIIKQAALWRESLTDKDLNFFAYKIELEAGLMKEAKKHDRLMARHWRL